MNKLNTENLIKLPNLDLAEFVQTVYRMSDPVGLGWMHHTEGELDDWEVEEIIEKSSNRKTIKVHMDYVRGRCCKMVVYQDEDGEYWIKDYWPDHSESQFNELLTKFKGEL